MAIMGIDLGTTGSKAVVFDLDGTILASSYREYDLISPKPGWLELSPEDVLDAVKTVVSEARSTCKDKIRAVAMSSLGEAAVPVDKSGNPLANAIVGFDPRGKKECEEFRKKLDPIKAFNITGHAPNSFHTLFKILHIREHSPELFAKTHKFLCFSDFIAVQLGLKPRIDYSLASRTMIFDVTRNAWSQDICEIADIDPAILSDPFPPGSAIGQIGENSLGFPAGAVLAAGLHDQPAGMLGAGIKPGEAMLATGTVVCMGVLLNQEINARVMTDNNLCRYPTFGNNYVNIAWNFTGGSALKWFRDNLAILDKGSGKSAYDLIIEKIPETPGSLMFLPYLTMTGTPFLDPQASGILMGLKLDTTRETIARAVMEGVAYELELNQELLGQAKVNIEKYKAIGGAAKSKIWMQMFANILNKPVSILQTTECAAWGVALLAANAAGLLRDLPDEAARKLAKTGQQFDPQADQVVEYQKRLAIYRQIYNSNKSIMHLIDEL